MITNDEIVKILKAGGKIYLRTRMGSCQCGDTCAEVFIDDGKLIYHSMGMETWQNGSGNAVTCNIPYGMGRTIQNIAAIYNGDDSIIDPESGSTYIRIF